MSERRDYLTQAGVTWNAVSFSVASTPTPVITVDCTHDDYIVVEVTNPDGVQSVACAAATTASSGAAAVPCAEQGLASVSPGQVADARYDVRGKKSFSFQATASGAGFSPVITIRRLQSWLP